MLLSCDAPRPLSARRKPSLVGRVGVHRRLTVVDLSGASSLFLASQQAVVREGRTARKVRWARA